MKSRRYSPGFTLVELLVVMSIIAVLIGILVPAVSRALLSVRIATTKEIIKECDMGLAAFKSDFGCYPPSLEQNLPTTDPFRSGAHNHIATGATQDTSNVKWYGNENLCFYLAGPRLTGWGSGATDGKKSNGALCANWKPFDKGQPTAERDYGPYYGKADDSLFGYNLTSRKRETILDGFTKDLRPIYYFLNRKGAIPDPINPNQSLTYFFWYDDCPMYDPMNTSSYGFSCQAQFDRDSTAHCLLPGGLKSVPYLLISPGEDRVYGEAVLDSVTGLLRPWCPSPAGSDAADAKVVYDDITNF